MNIKVLLFAHLREIVGSDEINLEMEAGCKGKEVFQEMETRFPELIDHRKYLKLSMNGEYIDMETEILDQAEVAIFPPVSGG